MSKIDKQTEKFLLIKQKISSTDKESLSKFTEHYCYSFLAYFNKKKYNSTHKNPPNNIPNSNQIPTDKSEEQKMKEKKKFSVVSEKIYEKNKLKTQQGKNHLNNIDTNTDIRGNANIEQNSPKKELTLLDIENNNIGGKSLTKYFAKKEKEEKKVINEQEIKESNEAVNEEDKEEKEKENFNDNHELSFDEDNKVKINELNEDEKLDNKVNLDLKNFESGMNENNNFEIFDNTKIDEQKKESIDCLFESNDSGSEDNNRETWNKKSDDVNEGEDKMKIEKENKEEKNEFKKPSPKKEKEKEKETKRSSSKICIPLDEKEKEKIIEKQNDKNKISKPPQSSKIPKTHKINSDSKNTNNINHINTKNKDEKFLQKKTSRNAQIEAKPTSSSNKKEINAFSQKNSNISKSKTKIIDDDDDEEFSLKKQKVEKEQKEDTPKKKEESIVTSEGNKFKLNFGIDENDTNKKNNSPKEISINIESIPENKNNKNIINKNGATNAIHKINNNIENNYDISCLDNINGILTIINDKLKNEKKEMKENNSIQKCFNLINEIKQGEYNFNNLIKRKKDTYINVFKLLKILFYFFSENNISKNFNNELVAICTQVQIYYKKVKKHDNSINKMDYFNKMKTYFKNIFSKLELRNYEKQNLKELCVNANSNNENNNSSTNNNNDKMIKFIKTSKRYLRTSSRLLREVKIKIDKLNNNETKSNAEAKKKFEKIFEDIKLSPHLISFNKLFKHFNLIFALFEELHKNEEDTKKKENHDERKKGKSMQVHKNGIQNKRETSMSNTKFKNNK